MATIFSRLRAYFNPRASIPDEDDHHREAISERERRAAELREQLALSTLDDKLKAISMELQGGQAQVQKH